jgi:mannose-6-phosphate isomerase
LPAEAISRFPLLLKYLDCQNVLSVQVHPDDAYGSQMKTPDLGKTEAWYIIDAQPGSLLYAGLKQGVSRTDLEQAIRLGRTQDCLHVLSPSPGDCIFIPAGTVHALGAGLVVAEIQQASDCTFRLYDWDRVDASGSSRPLHIQQALEVIDFDRGPVDPIKPVSAGVAMGEKLVHCDKFRLTRLSKPESYELDLSTCNVIAVPRGTATLDTNHGQIELRIGQSALIPHACGQAKLTLGSDTTVLVAEPALGSEPSLGGKR